MNTHCSSVTSLGYLLILIPTTYGNYPLWDRLLEHDSDGYFARRARDPQGVLRTIHSPFVHRRQNHRN
jgi:hypothetical protein